ncbi:hypothetical protein [Photorhabdus australis]|uniref:hypothetical protein n=1 Tax=Photorhabdus australis TaxID=286156 RepID=UPI0030D82758
MEDNSSISLASTGLFINKRVYFLTSTNNQLIQPVNSLNTLIPVIFQVALCWLHSPTPVTSLSIPFIFQAAALLAAFTCRRTAS